MYRLGFAIALLLPLSASAGDETHIVNRGVLLKDGTAVRTVSGSSTKPLHVVVQKGDGRSQEVVLFGTPTGEAPMLSFTAITRGGNREDRTTTLLLEQPKSGNGSRARIKMMHRILTGAATRMSDASMSQRVSEARIIKTATWALDQMVALEKKPLVAFRTVDHKLGKDALNATQLTGKRTPSQVTVRTGDVTTTVNLKNGEIMALKKLDGAISVPSTIGQMPAERLSVLKIWVSKAFSPGLQGHTAAEQARWIVKDTVLKHSRPRRRK